MTPPLFGEPIEPGEPKYTEDFLSFWQWSTKRGSKLDASKAWRKLRASAELTADIWAGMLEWKRSDQWQDETKQPHVSTWLNRRGWEEIVPRKPEAKHVHTAMCREFGFCPERTTL